MRVARRGLAAIAVVLVTGRVLAAQTGQAAPPAVRTSLDPAKGRSLIIPLDNTGVAGWRYLNPRRPPNIFADAERQLLDCVSEDARKSSVAANHVAQFIRSRRPPYSPGELAGKWDRECADKVVPLRIEFNNRTSDETFTVKFTVKVGGVVKELADEIAATEVAIRVAEDAAGPVAACVALTTARNESIELAGAPGQREAILRSDEEEQRLRRLERKTAESGLPPRTGQWPRPWETMPKLIPEVARAMAKEAASERERRALEQTSRDEIILPCLGVATSSASGVDVLDDALKRIHRYEPEIRELHQRLATLTVKHKALYEELQIRPPAEKEVPSASRVPSGKRESETHCVLTATADRCEFDLTIQRNQSEYLDASRLAEIVGITTGKEDAAPVVFSVSSYRTQDLVHGKGYVSLSEKPTEPESASTPALAASLKASSAPAGVDAITVAAPFGRHESHLPEEARFVLRQNLGNRAELGITAAVKKGNLGASEGAAVVTPSEYHANVYGLMGTVLTFGRFLVTAPGQKVAANVRADALQLAWRNVVISDVLQTTDDPSAPASRLRRKDRLWIAEAKNLSRLGRVRNLNLLFLAGRATRSLSGGDPLTEPACLADPVRCAGGYDYWTTGGDFLFPVSKILHGTYAEYYSWRRGDGDDRSGDVQLLTLTLTPWIREESGLNDRVRVPRAFTATVGRGSADSAGSTRLRGYIGETTGFTPDVLFLSGFSERIRGAGKSLENKLYASLSYTDQVFSPPALLLDWLGRRLKAPKTNVVSRATVVTLHHYRARRPLETGRRLGSELDVQFQVQAPKGVKWELGLARFWPGDALRGMFDSQPLALSASVAINVE